MKHKQHKDNKNFKREGKNFRGGGRSFGRKEVSFETFRTKEEKKLEEISFKDVGRTYSVKGIIDSVSQTSGPTLFNLSDGTGTLLLKGFESPGERAHPHVKEGDAIEATVNVKEYNGSLEGEIKKIDKLSTEAHEKMLKEMKEIERERAKPENVDFLVDSVILDKLKDRFMKAATEIRLAIIQNRPIIVRHHNDTDGYSAGYALERAILPLIEKQHSSSEKAAWEFYLRAPCAAPFYEIEDSIRDTAMSLRNEAKFSNKMPLIIIADNGSAPEDLLAIQQGKVHGIDFIVVDHHFFDKDVISKEVLVHINPFLVGEDGAKFSAGMLCVELARFIHNVENMEHIAAMAGIADRIDNPHVVDEYIRLASKTGYNKNMLAEIALVIDFASAKLRFMEAREYIEVLFGEPMHKQKALVALLAPYIFTMEKKGLEIGLTNVHSEKVGSVLVQSLEIEKAFSRGFYPKAGKCNGLVHDYAAQKNDKVVSLGILEDAITIRATDGANFSVHDFIHYAKKNIPEAFVEGGGHKNAGAIKFVPARRDLVLDSLKKFIKQR